MLIEILLLIVGFVCLVKGADWFVDGAANVAQKLGIPELVVGLTIVAMGSSMPEAAISIDAALRGNPSISIGNIAGSNIMNVLVILGLTATLVDLRIQKSTQRYEIPFVIFITGLMMVFGNTTGVITRVEGIIFWALFLLFLGYLFRLARMGQDVQPGKDEEADHKPMSLFKCVAFIVVGCFLVVKGSDLVVNSASEIARFFGVTERFIGLTIIAFGTSLPELVTSLIAARSRNDDLAIGNIVGSNIFNILFVVGTTALISDVPFEKDFVTDCLIGILSMAILWASTAQTNILSRSCGLLMLLCYAGYFTYLCM